MCKNRYIYVFYMNIYIYLYKTYNIYIYLLYKICYKIKLPVRQLYFYCYLTIF